MPTLKRLLRLLRTSCRKRVSLLSFKTRNRRKVRRENKRRSRFGSFMSVFWPFKRSVEEMDQVKELKSFSERDQAPSPSPRTPAFMKSIAPSTIFPIAEGDDDVEEACRGFENYLVEMIVEEGKVRDLTDVEELLHCWNSLKSPVFVELVSRFYGELCKDLFSGTNQYELLDDTMYE